MSNDSVNVSLAMQRMHNQRRNNIAKSFGQTSESIEKANQNNLQEVDENPFEKAVAEDGIEKSDIMNAISYGGNIKIKKTGKEIKNQLTTVVIPAKQSELSDKKKAADDLLEDCGDAPTKAVCPWWTDDLKIDVPYKVYDWNETDFRSCEDDASPVCNSLNSASQNTVKENKPNTVDEAKARRDYNDAIRCVAGILVDIKACELLSKNLKDNESVELTPRQVIAFMMD